MINNVFFSITGDCQQTGNGAFSLTIDGNSPDYTIVNLSPVNSVIPLGPYETGYTATNLTGGTYTILVLDALYPENEGYLLQVPISTGTCVSIIGVENTICGGDNGSLTAQTQFQYQEQTTYYLYNNSNTLIQTITTPFAYAEFFNLDPGFYYVVADDGAGCTGSSESIIIKDSTNLNYSLYVVDNSSCNFNLGKIFVSGLTGNPPYTYQWSNGITGQSFITGLTQGSYTVTVTDATGCQVTKTAVVKNSQTLSVVSVISENPTCFDSDGEITIFISGGSAPYYFSGSNGVTEFTFNQQYTFTGLAGGNYYFEITDAGLCRTTTSTNLIPSAGFVVGNISVINSNCNGFGGEIQITLIGGTSTYTYQIEDSLGNIQTITTSSLNYIFDNLISGTYTITISSSTSECVFTDTYTVSDNVPFDITTIVTGTTCGRSNGYIGITITVPDTYQFKLNGVLVSPSTISPTGATLSNLPAGNYILEVIDSNACSQVTTLIIPASQNINFITTVIDDDIYLSITQGTPPYDILWYTPDQILPETGTTLFNVSPGTYYVRVIDANGCIKTSKPIIVNGVVPSGRTSTFNVCSSIFVETDTITRGISQMFFDGYVSLIEFETNCNLVFADFTVQITVNGVVYSNVFYTSNNMADIPSNDIFFDTIRSILLGIDGIGEVNINPFTNTIEIKTDCNSEVNLSGAQILIEVIIDYFITCQYCTYLFIPCNASPQYSPINVGIIPGNFVIGDIIIYDGFCYRYDSDGTGSPVILKDVPDFSAGNCTQCIETL